MLSTKGISAVEDKRSLSCTDNRKLAESALGAIVLHRHIENHLTSMWMHELATLLCIWLQRTVSLLVFSFDNISRVQESNMGDSVVTHIEVVHLLLN